jgi:hypothetical protein
MSTNEQATAYTYPILSRLHEIGGKPNRQHILRTTQELTANAASVDSIYGNHGHAFLTMTPADYTMLNGGVAFVPPVQPPPNPEFAAGASAATIAEAVRQHGVRQKGYALMRTVQATLRKMLLTSSDEIYWRRMRQNIILYSGRTVLELLHHINTTYGSFTEAERRDVSARMEVPWEGGPLETVIQQIQEASEAFGLGGAGLSDTQMRDKLYDLVSASNLLPEACQQWRMRNDIDKTWEEACTHFQQFANDRDQIQTAGGAGFHANHVEEAMTDLNQQVANLSVSNLTQAATIQELTTKLAASNATYQAYKDVVNSNSNSNRSRTGGRGGGYEYRPQPQPPRQNREHVIRYCHTHGSCAHLGTACRARRTGHIESATFDNRQGGSNMGCN